MTTIITAGCVLCNAQREIGEEESKRLTETHTQPMCLECGMPMISIRARIIGEEQEKS